MLKSHGANFLRNFCRWLSNCEIHESFILQKFSAIVWYIFNSHWVTCPHSRLLVICNYHNRSDLMKLMISCLDFAHDVKSRVILSKILTVADSKMRLYATKHMRVLLRSKMPFFNSWGLEMLIYQVKYIHYM